MIFPTPQDYSYSRYFHGSVQKITKHLCTCPCHVSQQSCLVCTNPLIHKNKRPVVLHSFARKSINQSINQLTNQSIIDICYRSRYTRIYWQILSRTIATNRYAEAWTLWRHRHKTSAPTLLLPSLKNRTHRVNFLQKKNNSIAFAMISYQWLCSKLGYLQC